MSDDKINRAWQAFYETSEGRAAIGHLLADLNIYEEITDGTPMEVGIRVGQRNVACKLAKYLHREPDRFVDDVKEDVNVVDAFLMSTAQGD